MAPQAAHHRRSVRLRGYDYSLPGAYFVTAVTWARASIFGDIMAGMMRLSTRGKIAEDCWRLLASHFAHVELGSFVVMPNHIHGILVLHEHSEILTASRRGTNHAVGAHHGVPLPGNLERFGRSVRGSLASIMRQYKSSVTRRIMQEIGGGRTVWQRGFYDHVIRNEEEWSRIHLYIEANPANWAQDEENPLSAPMPTRGTQSKETGAR